VNIIQNPFGAMNSGAELDPSLLPQYTVLAKFNLEVYQSKAGPSISIFTITDLNGWV
jgi:hypothetical protein